MASFWHAVLALSVLLAATALACVADMLDHIRAERGIRFGFPSQVPYADSNEKGQVAGTDTTITRLVFARMGMKK